MHVDSRMLSDQIATAHPHPGHQHQVAIPMQRPEKVRIYTHAQYVQTVKKISHHNHVIGFSLFQFQCPRAFKRSISNRLFKCLPVIFNKLCLFSIKHFLDIFYPRIRSLQLFFFCIHLIWYAIPCYMHTYQLLGLNSIQPNITIRLCAANGYLYSSVLIQNQNIWRS